MDEPLSGLDLLLTGTLAIELKSRVGAGEVRGIDASLEMIEDATARAARAGVDITSGSA